MTLSYSIRSFVLAAVLFALTPLLTLANGECSFSRTLSLGDTGEDVRCLQVFLNSAGVTIAETGVGSPGNETQTYGPLTESAVLRWQKSVGVAGANGNFGPASQAAYERTATPVVAVAGTDENLSRIVADLQQQLALGLAEAELAGAPTPQVAGVSDSAVATENEAAEALKELVVALRDLDEGMNDSASSDIADDASDIRLNLYEALLKYFAGEYSAVVRLAEALVDDVDDVEDALEESTEADSAEEVVDDAWDVYKDADDEVDEAEDNDESGADDARDLLDEARDLLNEAEDELDDEEWEDAEELAEEAEELIEEALDEL